MTVAEKHIRVSDKIKQELDQRREEGESYNDVLERVLSDNRELLIGFGAFEETDRGDNTEAVRRKTGEKSARRIKQMAESRSDE